jgi:hypothetical protein
LKGLDIEDDDNGIHKLGRIRRGLFASRLESMREGEDRAIRGESGEELV